MPNRQKISIEEKVESAYYKWAAGKISDRIQKSIKSTIKYRSYGCTRRAKNPQYIAENILSRKFHADTPNEKWLTDVTEFKWYEGPVVHKLYLSAILDLYNRRIVSFVISERNQSIGIQDLGQGGKSQSRCPSAVPQR